MASQRISVKKTNRRFFAYFWSILILVLVILIALRWGASVAAWEVVLDLRVPRVLLALGVGMGLAVGGAVLQVLFSNPLCEPYILGISSGSAVGVVIGLSSGLSWNFGGLVGTSFLGALAFAGVLYWASHRIHRSGLGKGRSVLLLIGVMLGFLGNSLLALWLALGDPTEIQNASTWFFGDLSRARLSGAIIVVTLVVVICAAICSWSSQLDALLLGEEEASAIGVDVQLMQKTLIGLTSILVGLCVSGGGVIGFVGLLVPHGVRRWVGASHRDLLPLCALWGAIALVFADWVSRWLWRPYELPVGVVTALVGAPCLIGILLRDVREVD